MDEIEVKVHDMSSTIRPADAYALVLEEKHGYRKLPVIIGSIEAQAIKIAMNGYKISRPLTHDLFVALTDRLGVFLKKMVIYMVKDGVFYSYLYFDNYGEEVRIDSRTSDAVALALRYGAPIFTTRQIMEAEHMHEERNGAFSVTINMVNVDMLREALQKAIEEENYEQASKLRDEINRREQSQNKDDKL